jgi:hypothetical protein
MFSILSDKGNANRNIAVIHLTPVKMAIIKKKKTNAREDVERPFYTVGGNENWYSRNRNPCAGSSRS